MLTDDKQRGGIYETKKKIRLNNQFGLEHFVWG